MAAIPHHLLYPVAIPISALGLLVAELPKLANSIMSEAVEISMVSPEFAQNSLDVVEALTSRRTRGGESHAHRGLRLRFCLRDGSLLCT